MQETKLLILRETSLARVDPKKSKRWSDLLEVTKVSKTTLYQHLEELQGEALVEKDGEDRYRITEKGWRTLLSEEKGRLVQAGFVRIPTRIQLSRDARETFGQLQRELINLHQAIHYSEFKDYPDEFLSMVVAVDNLPMLYTAIGRNAGVGATSLQQLREVEEFFKREWLGKETEVQAFVLLGILERAQQAAVKFKAVAPVDLQEAVGLTLRVLSVVLAGVDRMSFKRVHQ